MTSISEILPPLQKTAESPKYGFKVPSTNTRDLTNDQPITHILLPPWERFTKDLIYHPEAPTIPFSVELETLKVLESALKFYGWSKVVGASHFYQIWLNGEKHPYYGSIWGVTLKGKVWELPPGDYEPTFARDIQDKRINLPEGSGDIIKLKKKFDAVFWPSSGRNRQPGAMWVLKTLQSGVFEVINGIREQPILSKSDLELGLINHGEPEFGEWVVRRGNRRAGRKYLDERFPGTKLDIRGNRGIITAAPSFIGAIIGKRNVYDERHLDQLCKIFNLENIQVESIK
jgi:hypothetical protein